MSDLQGKRLDPPTDPALRRIWDEGRLAGLRAARNQARRMNGDTDVDPYLWGYGGQQIEKKLADMASAARGALERGDS